MKSQDILNTKFKKKLFGYDKKQVQKFVDKVISEFENVVNYNKEIESEMHNLQSQLEKFSEIEISLREALESTQNACTQIKDIAYKEGQLIVDEAEKNANRIISESLLRAREIDYEVETLQRAASMYKKRLTNLLDNQKEMLDILNIKE